MGRRKSVRELQRQLQYAQAAAAYQPPAREEGSATKRQPKIAVEYEVLSSLAGGDVAFTIQASQAGITFFGGVQALGLAQAGTEPAPPRGFKPAQVHAMVADGSPSVVRARASNRPYVRYGRGSRGGGTQYNYTAPITANSETGIDTRVQSVLNTARANLGGLYGRAWYTAEKYPLSVSG